MWSVRGLVLAMAGLLVLSVQPVAAAQGPHLVRDLGTNELVQTFVPIGDRMLFTAEDDVHGRELFVTDGTFDGTQLVKDIRPGSAGSLLWSSGSDNPNSMVSVGLRAYFLANDGTHGRSIYVSDGTANGTIRLMRRRPCGDGSDQLTPAGPRLVFAARDTSGACNIYATDGTVDGTVLVAPDVPAFRQPVFMKGWVYFVSGSDPVNGQLWRTSGLPGGATNLVRRFSAQIAQMTVAGPRIYFTVGLPGSNVARLWRSNGTKTGTKLVNPADPLSAVYLTSFNGTLIFGVYDYLGDGVWDKSLWRTDSRGRTRMLTDFGTDRYSSVSRLWVASNRVFMLAGVDLPNYGLWTTDGKTRAGTHFVAPMDFFVADNVGPNLYGMGCYRNQTPVSCGYGHLLMASDGTPEGSHHVEGAVNLLPDVLAVAGTVFINVNGELWSYVP